MTATTLAPPLAPALARRLEGHPFVALLDIDGTLAPIAPHPGQAAIPAETRQVLLDLALLPDVSIVGVSGRSAADAARILDFSRAWVVGNHGLEVAAPGESARVRPEVARFADPMAAAVAECRALAAGRVGVLVEDKRWTLSVHVRLADAATSIETIMGAREIADRLGLRARTGRRVIELRPPVDDDKGTAALDVLARLNALGLEASIFCAGDDRTDEDMFIRLRATTASAVTVRVLGAASDSQQVDYDSAAEFSVENPAALRDLLEVIVDLRRA
jgi:trehalose 6-phosphate phosphatase